MRKIVSYLIKISDYLRYNFSRNRPLGCSALTEGCSSIQYKDFKDYPELLTLLQDRNLTINDKNQAIEFLKRVHYYRLSPYFEPFQHPKGSQNQDIFKNQTTFENIQNLYLFDCELRRLIFFYLEELELILRAQISYIHAKAYQPFGYLYDLNSLKRNLKGKKKPLFNEFILHINQNKKQSKEEFVKHIPQKYNINNLPIWALVEILPFGGLSKFFKLMQNKEQIELLSFFGIKNLSLNVFENWLEALTYTRNICAHHSRLWNRNFVIKFKQAKKYPFLDSTIRTDKVFFALSVLGEILKNPQIKVDFKTLLAKYPTIPTKAMGIPSNWQNLAPWNNL